MRRHDKSEDAEVKPENKKQEIITAALDWLIAIAVGVLVGIVMVIFVVQRDNVTVTRWCRP